MADSDGTLNVVSDSSCNAAAYADVGWNGSVKKRFSVGIWGMLFWMHNLR